MQNEIASSIFLVYFSFALLFTFAHEIEFQQNNKQQNDLIPFNSSLLDRDSIKDYQYLSRVVNGMHQSQTPQTSCEPSWKKSMHKLKWIDSSFPDLHLGVKGRHISKTTLHVRINALCELRFGKNSFANKWEADGGGPGLDRTESLGLGGSDCGNSMGKISRPIDNDEFKRRKFMAVYYLPEQMSKARRHMAEMLAFAKETNRILILPRVGQTSSAGVVSMGGILPFCSYFDVQKLSQLVDWITFEHFLERSWQNHFLPKVRFICLKGQGNKKCAFQFRGSFFALRMLPLLALTQGILPTLNNTLVFNRKEKWMLVFPKGLGRASVVIRVVQALEDMDLIVMGKVSNSPALDYLPYASYITYAPSLQTKAQSLITILDEYVAVHVRLEQIARMFSFVHQFEARMLSCLHGLETLLKKKFIEKGIDTVFVSSDVTSNGGKSRSWRPKFLKSAVLLLSNALSTIEFVSWELIDAEFNSLDLQVQGILDKLVCQKATYFVTASTSCGGHHSYDAEIILSRRKMLGGRNLTFEFREKPPH